MARFVSRPRMDPPSRRYGAASAWSDEEILSKAREFYEAMQRRRTIRDYSDRPVPHEVIEYCIRAAGTAPSGANLQPWHFVAVSDPAIKHEIRIAAEKEEKEFYERRAPKAWLEALAPLGTDSNKPFLETAPWLIAIFAQPFRILADGTRSPAADAHRRRRRMRCRRCETSGSRRSRIVRGRRRAARRGYLLTPDRSRSRHHGA